MSRPPRQAPIWSLALALGGVSLLVPALAAAGGMVATRGANLDAVLLVALGLVTVLLMWVEQGVPMPRILRRRRHHAPPPEDEPPEAGR